MTALFQHEIDIVGSDGYEARTKEWAERFGCTAEVITHEGPAGGNPLYRIIGPMDNLRSLFEDYCRQAYDDGDCEEELKRDMQELFDPGPYTQNGTG